MAGDELNRCRTLILTYTPSIRADDRAEQGDIMEVFYAYVYRSDTLPAGPHATIQTVAGRGEMGWI